MSGQQTRDSANEAFRLSPDSENRQATVLIADDHALVREATALVLQGDLRFRVLQASSLQETLSMLSMAPVDLILLDLVMPGMDGMAGLTKVIAADPKTRVVLFSGSTNSRFVAQALEQGARGFVPKTMSLKSVANAINMIIDGEVYLPASMLSELRSDRISLTSSSKGLELSEVERHTLVMAGNGRTNKEIAWELQTTEVLVKMHMRSICRKLEAKNRAHAAIRARELGLM